MDSTVCGIPVLRTSGNLQTEYRLALEAQSVTHLERDSLGLLGYKMDYSAVGVSDA